MPAFLVSLASFGVNGYRQGMDVRSNPYPPCCDLADDPRHPKGDPTYYANCHVCGIATAQSFNRDSRGRATGGFSCGVCATKAFHANPPTEPLVPDWKSDYTPPAEPQEIGEMPAWMTGEGDQ